MIPDLNQTDSKLTLPERVKIYADAPDKITKNKYLVYQTRDIDHSINLLLRLVKDGWKIRAAYHEFPSDGIQARTVRIDQHAKTVGLI
jgi:hypothetical protein